MLGYRFVVLTYVIGIALVCVISIVAVREQLEMVTREKRRPETLSKCKEGSCLPSLQQFNNNGKGELWKQQKNVQFGFFNILILLPKVQHALWIYISKD
jgi:hypothetical protein